MSRPANRSRQTRLVLESLLVDPRRHRHGYELARETGLKSGTLYPILKRLAGQGFLESSWEDPPPEGRPRRHLYRLTASGKTLAAESVEARPRRVRIGGAAWSG